MAQMNLFQGRNSDTQRTDMWTKWGKKRVELTGRLELTYLYYQI